MESDHCIVYTLQEHSRSDDLIGDFCDGLLFKHHLLFSKSPKSLQLIVYFDEVEVCNPLGGHAGIHKLGTVHFVGACVPVVCIHV